MTITLNSKELVALVESHISDTIGVQKELLDIKFKGRNQGMVDTTIDILTDAKKTSKMLDQVEDEDVPSEEPAGITNLDFVK